MVNPTCCYLGNYQLTNIKKWEAPIYLTAVLEYLTAELLELAGEMAKAGKKTRIAPRHIMLAIRNDEEVMNLHLNFNISSTMHCHHQINKLMSEVTIAAAGVVPGIHQVLLPKKSQESSM